MIKYYTLKNYTFEIVNEKIIIEGVCVDTLFFVYTEINIKYIDIVKNNTTLKFKR